jgi:proline iminopeptidase
MAYFPKRKPYKKGYFAVTDGHRLHYALYGNPKGIPVLFVHGGPGAGCNENAYRFFNPKKFNILLVDQRGAGKSKPFAGLKGNTTQKLIDDFRRFLDFLHIKKAYLFGGSWGSCLSLCFAIKYPKRVQGMVLRGVFFGGSLKDDFMLTGGPRKNFPEVWERFASAVHSKTPATHYWSKMISKNKKTALHYCREWSRYEMSLLSLEYDPVKVKKRISGNWIIPLALLEAYYFKHNCFLPKSYILRNVNKIKHIPVSLVHGRYDFVCEPRNAYLLHKALPRSRLFFVTAAHSASDPAIREKTMQEIHAMARKAKAKNLYY